VKICKTIRELRTARAALASPVGLVPTMGALHAGHESLIARARADCRSSVVSVYVNPSQFAPGEDFTKYPRSFDGDAATLERLAVDVCFAPADDEMYPESQTVWVEPGPLASALEGERRPGHFRGVATVVLKLLNLVAPERAYFGRKDAQQLAVVEAMVRDLSVPVAIVACPTVREPDGLALSSRNRYLSAADRADAVRLHRALKSIARAGADGGTDVDAALREAAALLEPLRSDYLAVVDPREFLPLASFANNARLLAVGAALCGETRLIDNVEFTTP
jgi:pantoate--beta-alanine ligase